MSDPGPRLILLRHGEIASHRGDVPVTDAGIAYAERAGQSLGREIAEPILLLFGGTRRTRETAEAVARGIDDGRVRGPQDSFALRNPDMYVAGSRVNMVSSAEALAEQVPDLTVEEVSTHRWWTDFFVSPDRIGWWLGQDDPPGENGADLARRVGHFVASLSDPGPARGCVVVGVTHSPILRAVLRHGSGSDPGEPAYVSGAEVRLEDGHLLTHPYDPLAP